MTLLSPLSGLRSGAGAWPESTYELARVGVRRSLRLKDGGLNCARAIAPDLRLLSAATIPHFDVPGDQIVAGANALSAAYRAGIHSLQFLLPLSPAVGERWSLVAFIRRLTPHRNQSYPEVE